MKLMIDISKDCYDAIMARDWKTPDGFFSEELKAIHDGKIVEQEPCEDAISRQAVWDVMQELWGTSGELIDRLMDLPPVTPAENLNKWIPVSERLPNFAGVYLVTRYFPNNVMNPTYLVDACFFDGTDTWHNDNRINHERKYLTNVVAWLEEPEPYKAESEG